jgi:hypothetical protein
MFMGVIRDVPMSGGINDLELWLLSCIFFVFAALLVYAIILCQKSHNYCSKISSMNCNKTTSDDKQNDERPLLDKLGIIFLPTSYVIYVVIYFFQQKKEQLQQ